MTTKYTVFLYSAGTGNEIMAWSVFDKLQYARRVGARGSIVFEALADLGVDMLPQLKDSRIVVWRQPDGGAAKIDFAGKLRGYRVRREGKNLRFVLRGVDYNDDLYTRIVAYPAGSSESAKSGLADDIMKEIVRENLGSSASIYRNISATGFYVAADTGSGTSLTKGMAWENVLDTLQEISKASYRTPATGVTFGVVPLGKGVNREFVTRIGQWGADQRNRVVFSEANGNMVAPEVEVDAMDEVTYIYAGGQGQGEERMIVEEEDTLRSGESTLNRREAFFDGGNYDTESGLTAVAQAKLEEGRPVFRVDFQVQDTQQTVYGRDWGLGDLTTVQVFGWQYDCHIAAIQVNVAGNKETVTPQLEFWG